MIQPSYGSGRCFSPARTAFSILSRLFRGGEAEDWIERTVRVPTIFSLT
jgi:hypothetical protein